MNHKRVSTHGIPTASLYCGAGGMDYGFSLAGFESVFANDLDEDAVSTFNGIFGSEVAVAGNIAEATLPPRADVEVVIGGPPCQGFSVAARPCMARTPVPAEPRSCPIVALSSANASTIRDLRSLA